ncbi:MAG TPA: hypothetical protein VM123_10365 [archaeon]|nr:hypothetical protein [archaeon]
MFYYRFKSNHLVPTLLITLLCLFGVTILKADIKIQGNAAPAAASYKEDINQDGLINFLDVVALINLGTNDPQNPVADYNGNGHYSISDVISLLVNIVNGNLTPLPIFSISGRMVQNGQGLEGVKVGIKSELIDTAATTDSSGIYCIESLINGTYTVTPLKTDYLFIPKSVEVSTSEVSSTAPDINAVLAVYTLSGRILVDSIGLVNVAVRFEGGPEITGGEIMIKKKAKTDSLGMFTIKGLPDGIYDLWCKHSIYNYTFIPDPMEVTISGNSISVNIQARLAGYTIRGRVIENNIGLYGVSVRIVGVGIDTVVVTDSTGLYWIDGAKDANYSVMPEKENYTFNPISLTARVWGDSVAVPDIKATYLGPSAAKKLFVIGGRVTCTVTVQMNVHMILTGDLEASTVTDANGFYSFLVPSGEYKIIGIPNPTFQMFNPPFINVRVQGYDILNLDIFAWGTKGP